MSRTIEVGLNEKSVNGAENRPLTYAEFAGILRRAIATDPDMVLYGSASSYAQDLSYELDGFTAEDVWAMSHDDITTLPVRMPRDVDAITSQRQFANYRAELPLIVKDTPNGPARVFEPFQGFEVITDDNPWGSDLPSHEQIKRDAVEVFLPGVGPVPCASPEHLIESYLWLNRNEGRNGVWKGDSSRVALMKRILWGRQHIDERPALEHGKSLRNNNATPVKILDLGDLAERVKAMKSDPTRKVLEVPVPLPPLRIDPTMPVSTIHRFGAEDPTVNSVVKKEGNLYVPQKRRVLAGS